MALLNCSNKMTATFAASCSLISYAATAVVSAASCSRCVHAHTHIYLNSCYCNYYPYHFDYYYYYYYYYFHYCDNHYYYYCHYYYYYYYYYGYTSSLFYFSSSLFLSPSFPPSLSFFSPSLWLFIVCLSVLIINLS